MQICSDPVRFFSFSIPAARRLLVVLSIAACAWIHAPDAVAATDASVQRLPACSWDKPGRDPYMGDLVASIDHYTDLPADVRTRLKARVAQRDYDDIATIRRDAIEGQRAYEPEIRDMHFGTRQMCASVSRAAWPAKHQERGLVYCDGDTCLIVPTVCRNLSRVTRRPLAPLAAAPAAEAPPGDELVLAPPAAGPADAAEGLPSSAGPAAAPPITFAEGTAPAWVPLVPVGFPAIPGGLDAGPSRSLPTGPIAAVPEPSSTACMVLGLLIVGLLGARANASLKQRMQRF
jgi:hypothetical protein